MLQIKHARERQRELLGVLQRHQLDSVVLGLPHHVYYESAYLSGWLQESAFVLFPDGRSWLLTGKAANVSAAADEIESYDARWNSTLRQELAAVVAGKVLDLLKGRHITRIGVDASAITSQVAMQFEGEMAAIDADLWQLRRRKYPDELDLMNQAIRCTEAMYRRARQIIEPGVAELKVFNELHAVAVETAGEALSDRLGNDYTCGGGGGMPRKNHMAQAGQIYILDLGPAYRGYYADNCRAFSVDGKPTDEQMKVWHGVAGVFGIVERMARPGARCRDICLAVDEHLMATMGRALSHHLGHGVGLQPHEFPHLNPKWDDVLIEGEVFTAEPGIYGRELGGGMRIENQYLVTGDGVKNLVDFPMELT